MVKYLPFQQFIHQTYLIALEKDPDDKMKLRQLGVPSAIRHITGILLLHEHAPTFTEYLLPFNYAIGVGDGVEGQSCQLQSYSCTRNGNHHKTDLG